MRSIAFVLLILLHAAAAVAAPDYPSKPIRLIVPFAAGGGNDAVARTIAQKISAGLRQAGGRRESRRDLPSWWGRL